MDQYKKAVRFTTMEESLPDTVGLTPYLPCDASVPRPKAQGNFCGKFPIIFDWVLWIFTWAPVSKQINNCPGL